MSKNKKVLSLVAGFLLWPLALLWESIYKFRRFCYNYGIYPQNKFQVPVISIGNLTFGGTGKTPFTLWLSKYLGSMDKKVMILTRGYKGKLEHKSGILRSGRRLGYNPFEYGDEALVLARRLENASIVVGKNRSENLRFYFEEESPDVVLLDDGHQHLKLHRNTNIVLFDTLMPLSKYKVAPLGYMREGFSALKDAELIVLGRCDQSSVEQKDKLKSLIREHNKIAPFAEIAYEPIGFYYSSYEKAFDVDAIKGKNVICVAGIASPLSFYNLVESLGGVIVHKEAFPDHHYFNSDEISRLLEKAEAEDAIIVTTEKDIVKWRRISDDQNVVYLEIQVNFLAGEKETQAIISKTFLNSL